MSLELRRQDSQAAKQERARQAELFLPLRHEFVNKLLEIHPIRVKNRRLSHQEFLDKLNEITKELEERSRALGVDATDYAIHPLYNLFGETQPTEKERQKVLKDYEEIHLARAFLRDILLYLEKDYHIQKVYYPGAGPDRNPVDTLGVEKVINLDSIDESIHKLGEAQKVVGDYSQNPFADNSFDATLAFGITLDEPEEQLQEFMRVTKKNGFIVLGNDHIDVQEKKVADALMPQVTLPPDLDFPHSDSYCVVYRNTKK